MKFRNFKFRCLDLDAGVIRYFDFDNFNASVHDVYGNTTQCLDIKDINNKMLYEGDIVHCFAGENYQGVYEFSETGTLVVEDGTLLLEKDGVYFNVDQGDIFFEKLGNVYEEILKNL